MAGFAFPLVFILYHSGEVLPKLTNEELAALAKTGDRAARAALWEQNRGLLAVLFRRLYVRAGARMAQAGVTWEDVEQCGFLAIVQAAQRFEPERGVLFASFLSYAVKSVFFELIGYRTERTRREPLNCACSLDEPVTGEDGSETPRGELTPDSTAEWAYEDAEQRVYQEQLRRVLDTEFARLTPLQQAVVRARFYDGLTLAQTSERLSISTDYARRQTRRALFLLGRSPRLARFRERIIREGAYHGTGWQAWKYGGSVEERILLKLEELT